MSLNFLVQGNCSGSTSSHLAAILKKNFNCKLKETKNYEELVSCSIRSNPSLIFLIVNTIAGCQSKKLEQIASIPKILVLCSQESQLNGRIEFYDDLIRTPLIETEVICRVKNLLGLSDKAQTGPPKNDLFNSLRIAQVVGQDPAFLDVISKIKKIGNTDITILMSGETGVGKEVCARALHYISNRYDRPFIPVNCGAIPATLIENEFYGHDKGAYTDARNKQLGLVAEAEGGTLFLDEINSLPLPAQSKLLRLLQDKTYRPLGLPKDLKSDVRIIASTNVNLWDAIQAGFFREDLFYRLNVITLRIPPLRERASDIPILADHFLKRYCKEYKKEMKSLSSAAILKMMHYHWPGNIRQLENIMQQAILFTQGSVIPSECLNLPISENDAKHDVQLELLSFKEAKRKVIAKFEKEYVVKLLNMCGGNITQAARKAQKDRADFNKLVKKYNIAPDSYRALHH